jgi:copper chaperone CopZ
MSTTNTYAVEGMTCAHCVAAVTGEITTLPGVRDVAIDLVAGGVSALRVTSDDALEPAVVSRAVDGAGYRIV